MRLLPTGWVHIAKLRELIPLYAWSTLGKLRKFKSAGEILSRGALLGRKTLIRNVQHLYSCWLLAHTQTGTHAGSKVIACYLLNTVCCVKFPRPWFSYIWKKKKFFFFLPRHYCFERYENSKDFLVLLDAEFIFAAQANKHVLLQWKKVAIKAAELIGFPWGNQFFPACLIWTFIKSFVLSAFCFLLCNYDPITFWQE